MSDVTTQTAGDVATTAPPKPWYKRPKVIIGLVLVLVVFLVLREFGTRRLRFSSDVTGEGAFDFAFFWSLVPQMLQALAVTTLATIQGFIVAAVLGLFLALGRRSSVRLISWPVTAFIEFIRSTPLLVQLFFLFYALPAYNITTAPLTTLTIGLGVHYATYCSEAYRAGINSVGKGQWEASTALNLSPGITWSRVVLPQAIPNVLPALGNFLVAAFKDAPLGSAIQVTGVLAFATSITGSTFRPVEPFLLIGVGFLMVSLPAAWFVRRLERYISYERT